MVKITTDIFFVRKPAKKDYTQAFASYFLHTSLICSELNLLFFTHKCMVFMPL